MANSQQHNIFHHQNKGTLTPGQAIAVNKYNVTVERFLSQGGFAHVYLVTTPTPVYNTTHHVLKRIAVQNEALLKDVKKEVDIMRLLKGHPNIVHLIDAAWHRMADGSFEVFILMELCPGGGIIDMMNRRLRERLTEAEILTIFADVCEGVACMHNLKPPLLHRDLKVENILQASATSYKLCDFGSAATVAPRPPATTQEIRALEADLNRHTTLQYRAPEMVDPFLRRPVDEKSDVWALGVLLYKLCYYTTPFEEHGPLAILNVQYRIPPYPVYSQQMNALIASMLREHGTSRPSVFELLSIVHALRGTTSPFKYTIPAPQPLTPHIQSFPKSPAPPVTKSPAPPTAKPSQISDSSRSSAIEAREKVLEAIAPMRRGRPISASPSMPPTDPQSHPKSKTPLVDFSNEEEKAWQNVAGHLDKEGKTPGKENPWALGSSSGNSAEKPSLSVGFGDSFAEKLWETYDRSASSGTPSQPPEIRTPALPIRPTQGRLVPKLKSTSPGRSKDAFDGLGLEMNVKAAPTLGEARKLRTGLATLGSSSVQPKSDSSGWNGARDLASKPVSSAQSGYLQPKATSQTQAPTAPSPTPSWKGMASRPGSATMDNAESRFPTLEELDADFTTSGRKLGVHVNSEPPQLPLVQPLMTQNVKSVRQPLPAVASNGARSQQVTGTAMQTTPKKPVRREEKLKGTDEPGHQRLDNTMHTSRPTLQRKHRSSITMKHTPARQPSSTTPQPPQEASPSKDTAPKLPPRPPTATTDWLTGDDDDLHLSTARATPVVRDSPSKRASFIEGSSLAIHEPLAALQDHAAVTVRDPPRASTPTSVQRKHPGSSKTKITMTSAEPAAKNRAQPSTSPQKAQEQSSSSSADEGPEEAVNSFAGTHIQPKTAERPRHKARQSSVHDLVDLWGGASPTKDKFDEPSRKSAEKTPSPETPKRKPTTRHPSSKFLPPRSHSPQPIRSSDPPRPSDGPATTLKVDTSNHIKQPSKPSPSPLSGKSRPQSMFLLPTRVNAVLEPPQTPKGLVPPDAPQGRRNRRTSISDMVQRYEAIGGIRIGNGAPPLTSAKSTPQTIFPDTSRDIASNLKRELLGSSVGPSKPPAPPASPGPHITHEPERVRREGFAGATPVVGDYLDKPASRVPARLPRSRSPHKDTSAITDKTDKEPSIPTTKSTHSVPDTPSIASPTPVFPLRKTGLQLDDPSSQPSQDMRSPSPERPYQGVGKLIDQWQRKAATSNDSGTAIPPRRGPLIPKRTGLVGGASGAS